MESEDGQGNVKQKAQSREDS